MLIFLKKKDFKSIISVSTLRLEQKEQIIPKVKQEKIIKMKQIKDIKRAKQ